MKRAGRLFMLLAVFFVAFSLSGCGTHYFRDGGKAVRVYLKYRGATTVLFACSLDRFRLRAAERAGGDTWMVEIPSGAEFSYFYVVDGRTYVPPCPLKEQDDFGSENCIYMRGM